MTNAATIVLADDDPVMRELAGAKLAEAGYAVVSAENGREALTLLKQRDIDLVVSDLDMPVMNGFELTSAIRSDPSISAIPVMVITASDQSDAVDRAFAAGATSFLAKPINWSLFNHAVKFVLRASEDRKALQAARDQAEAGARFKDSLMSVMSHELRTPLNAIIGFGQIIGEQFKQNNDPVHQEYSAYIIDSGKRLLSSVSDMLLASDARSGPITINEADVCLNALIDDAVAEMKNTLNLAGAALESRPADQDIEVTCDRTLVSRAIRKLIDNAVKFSSKNAKIFVGATLTRGGAVVIIVKDNGPGIEADKLAQVCAPFAQLDMSIRRSREGLGLGLPLVQAIAAAHQGSFRLDSKVGAGTKAIFSLPASRVRAIPTAASRNLSQGKVA
ncbi:hybrid sensor histidine kinase/response regulator [Hyphococcus sp.]|uniref:hybrid sensor histidine kinase/response regulator n=1 Tax=Hyphococcus sp. TaxID=2038636 RepID=UPI003CCC377A